MELVSSNATKIAAVEAQLIQAQADDDHAEALRLNRELSLARGIQRYRQQQYSRFTAKRHSRR
jgi:hypothetical protein